MAPFGQLICILYWLGASIPGRWKNQNEREKRRGPELSHLVEGVGHPPSWDEMLLERMGCSPRILQPRYYVEQGPGAQRPMMSA